MAEDNDKELEKLKDRVLEALEDVIDPELGIDLSLIHISEPTRP